MAAVTRVSGSKLLVQIGDGATPTEAFAHDCLINTARGIQFQSDTNEYIMPDCDNPDDPAWKEVTKDGLSVTITGAGMLYTASVENWFDWWKAAATKNVRFKLNVAATGYWAGKFHLSQMEIAADSNKDTATVSVTMISSGAVTWTDVP